MVPPPGLCQAGFSGNFQLANSTDKFMIVFRQFAVALSADVRAAREPTGFIGFVHPIAAAKRAM